MAETGMLPRLRARVVAGRLEAIDVARGLAIVGMLVAHVGPDAWVPDGGWGTTQWGWQVFHSRMPAMFAVTAGVAMAFMSGGRCPVSGRTRLTISVRIAVRAVLLGAIGVCLSALHTPAMVILVYFACYFMLALPVLGLSARWLWGLTVVLAVAGPLASYALRATYDLEGRVWRYLVTGDYPVLTWMAFITAGLAIGRCDLSERRVQRRLAVGGLLGAIAAYGGSALALALGGRGTILDSLPGAGTPEAHAVYGALTYAETGVTPTTSPAWLLTAAPHSGSWFDVAGCLAVCCCLIGALLLIGGWLTTGRTSGARRCVAPVWRVVADMGSMSLTLYAAHIVAMWALTATFGHDFHPGQPWQVLALFVIVLAAGAWAWQRWVGRGPLEALLHWASYRVAKLIPARPARGAVA